MKSSLNERTKERERSTHPAADMAPAGIGACAGAGPRVAGSCVAAGIILYAGARAVPAGAACARGRDNCTGHVPSMCIKKRRQGGVRPARARGVGRSVQGRTQTHLPDDAWGEAPTGFGPLKQRSRMLLLS